MIKYDTAYTSKRPGSAVDSGGATTKVEANGISGYCNIQALDSAKIVTNEKGTIVADYEAYAPARTSAILVDLAVNDRLLISSVYYSIVNIATITAGRHSFLRMRLLKTTPVGA